ncbi:MAG TPA: cyclase [Firmicutes bacterium]|nr:cyclase [Bacillota bacterium]
MAKYIDLTHVIDSSMPTYPGDDNLKLVKHKTLSQDGFNDSKLETGMHIGTHLDVASHLTEKKIYVSDYSVEQLIGRGCLLDVRNEPVIQLKKQYEELILEGDIVLLYTGFDDYFKQTSYFIHHPIVSLELAEFLVSKKVKIVGLDFPSPDVYPYAIHKLWLERGILIIENLKDLRLLEEVKSFDVMVFPLYIEAEGAPARVIAQVKDLEEIK